MIYIFGGAFDPPHVGHTAIVMSLLAKKHPEKIIIIPSSERDDKQYHVSDEHRLAMLEIFVDEVNGKRGDKIERVERVEKQEIGDIGKKVIIDDYFVKNWKGEMITKDVDLYAREKYGEDIIHVFGTDTIESMPDWDTEGYAAKVVKKIFVPRGMDGSGHRERSKNECGDQGSWIATCLAMMEHGDIENYELFTDCHIPDISSTELRKIIPEHTSLKDYYEEEPKFIIPGLSKRISQYILEKRLYRNTGIDIVKVHREEIVSDRNQDADLGICTMPMPKPRVLVHVCCGPDVTMPILALRDEYDVVCFWYDPNIQPREEHDKRYDAFVKVCEIEGIPYIKGAYDVKHFFTRIKGLEFTPEKGEKCTHCYDMRMYVAAKLAKRLKIPYYTSSLNTSPKKDLEKLFVMGHKYAEKYGITFLDIPFRKKGGFEKSVEYTRKHDIFRQDYCGCVYSIRDGGKGKTVG